MADALLATIAERGFAATTLRDVAAKAGVSVGLVQRYFRTRAELLRFGMQVVYERASRRIQDVPVQAPLRDFASQLVTTLFPVDEDREQEFQVWLAFLQASLHDPEIGRIQRESSQELMDGLTRVLGGAISHGELPKGIDPEFESRCLMAYVDGLSLHAVITTDGFDRDMLTAALRTYLDRLFTAPEMPS
ncbi:TetR family transcriptional regulator [Spiractinospora alimapuensis]|nr:TetR family transcriptional regulator [Spiractinospora alimapuensis]